jgi:hypothetical protein
MSSPQKAKESYVKPAKQKYRKLSEVITDETVIPPMPSVLIPEPQKQQLQQKIQKLNDEIKNLDNVLKTFI